jgi:hypothetical protein
MRAMAQPPLSRHERFLRAVAGLPVDRVPASAWMHFGSEHLGADMVAQLHQRYWQASGWDVLKVMADYRFEVPHTSRDFESAAQIAAIRPPTQQAPCFAEQLRCMACLMKGIGREVPLLNSGYDPYTMLLRHKSDNTYFRSQNAILNWLPKLVRMCSSTLVRRVSAIQRCFISHHNFSMRLSSGL